MDMKKLLEAVTKFSGEEVGQKPGDQVRGTEKAKPTKSGKDHPFKGRLVGASESVLKDLSQLSEEQQVEWKLREMWANFNEEDLGVHPKRAGRKSDRPSRGHKEHPRYKTIKADEGWESGPEEYKEPYDDADDAYDRMRQDKLDREAEAEWAKKPKVTTYKLSGRGPNMEPNYEFGGEFSDMDAAQEYRRKLMADPDTPHPEHIGIRTITRLAENSVTPLRDREDYHAKSKALQDIQLDPDTHKDPQLSAELARRKDILMQQAKRLGIDESRAHKVLNTWFKNRERQEKFAKGELKVPTPQERRAELAKPKQVKEYGASMSGATGAGGTATNTTTTTPTGAGNPTDPEAAKKAAAALTQIKAATNSPAPTASIAKALDAADQGKQVGSTDMKALKPMMDVIKQAAQDPKLANQFKTLSQQARQAQQQAK